MEHTGFGEIAPSACNQDENGRAINRRVEVWIQPAGRT
jgi:phosphate transport system substrate-binding protein